MAGHHLGAFGAPEVSAVWHWRAALGVSEHASPAEIKRAYRRAVKRVHPDLNPDNASAAAQFRSLHEGYETLIAIASRSSSNRFTDVAEGQF